MLPFLVVFKGPQREPLRCAFYLSNSFSSYKFWVLFPQKVTVAIFLTQIMASGTNEALRSAGSVLSGNETGKFYKNFVYVLLSELKDDKPLILVFIC